MRRGLRLRVSHDWVYRRLTYPWFKRSSPLALTFLLHILLIRCPRCGIVGALGVRGAGRCPQVRDVFTAHGSQCGWGARHFGVADGRWAGVLRNLRKCANSWPVRSASRLDPAGRALA